MSYLEKYIIKGGKPLHGEINVSGAKNVAVAMIPAAILADSPCTLENVPDISDVRAMIGILKKLGAVVYYKAPGVLYIDGTTINSTEIPFEQTSCMRASYYFIGALLGKYGKAKVASSGGCDLGKRPIDQHIKAFRALGAEVSWDGANNTAVVRKGTTTVACVIGENCVYRNGTKILNDAAAVIRGSRTYLPIRVVAEALDAEVLWDGSVRITSGAAGNLIYSIENSGSHVSAAELWKLWNTALLQKASADYTAAIETIKRIAPDFLAANDGNSNAMLYKHLGECYSELNLSAEASACFAREAQFWSQMG